MIAATFFVHRGNLIFRIRKLCNSCPGLLNLALHLSPAHPPIYLPRVPVVNANRAVLGSKRNPWLHRMKVHGLDLQASPCTAHQAAGSMAGMHQDLYGPSRLAIHQNTVAHMECNELQNEGCETIFNVCDPEETTKTRHLHDTTAVLQKNRAVPCRLLG